MSRFKHGRNWQFGAGVIAAVTVASIAAVTLVPPYAQSQQSPWTQRDALNEASSEAAQCHAYYAVSQKCAEDSGQTALSAQLQDAIDSSSKIQFLTGRAAGMSDQALLASLQLTLEAANSSIGNSCVNVSVLIVKYADHCKRLIENPQSRIQTLMLGPPTATDQ